MTPYLILSSRSSSQSQLDLNASQYLIKVLEVGGFIMKFRFTILLFSTNHITGNLVFLKMKAYGHKVFQADSTESVKKFLQNENLDLLVVDGIETSVAKKIHDFFHN